MFREFYFQEHFVIKYNIICYYASLYVACITISCFVYIWVIFDWSSLSLRLYYSGHWYCFISCSSSLQPILNTSRIQYIPYNVDNMSMCGPQKHGII